MSRRYFVQALCLIIAGLFIISGWGMLMNPPGLPDKQAAVRPDDLIRLHVLANSDHPDDQTVKLKVRDAVIEYLTPHLAGAIDSSDARRIVSEQEEALEAVVRDTVAEAGADYPVRLDTGRFEFPIRAYGGLVLPAGRYEAVRILLGEAEGKNWWCVLFPPLCFVSGTQTTAVTPQLAAADKNIPPDKVEFRLKLTEWWQQKSE